MKPSGEEETYMKKGSGTVRTVRNTQKVREYRRMYLPYGVWTLEDGSKVLFNRRYAPMHRRYPDGTITSWPAPYVNDHVPGSSTWVEWGTQTWFYDDGIPEQEKVNRGCRALWEWGLEPPERSGSHGLSVEISPSRPF
jgi:hypothetical protein